MESVFIELSAIIVLSTALALLAKVLRQPIILAFIGAGILLGPVGFNVLHSGELIDVLSTFGIALLLYVVGIELDIRKFKALSWPVLLTGIGQILVTGSIGWVLAYLLGFNIVEAWFIAITLTLSSTIVVVKLLSEKRQLESLYGRIAVSILLLQDFAAILALLLLDSFGGNHLNGIPWQELLSVAGKTVVIASIAYGLSKFVFKKIFLFIGRSQELLFLWSIAWCVLFAAIAVLWDYPMAISVFFAGLAIGSLDYNFEISARIRSLRDFFIVIFFAFLGSQLVLTMGTHLLLSAVVLSLFVLVGNPLIVYVILRLTKQHDRTAFFTGLTMAQISEFSFILANLGLSKGFIGQELVSMIAVIGLLTMVLSTYMITYNEKIYRSLAPLLRWLPLPKALPEVADQLPNHLKDHYVVFGYHANVDHLLKELIASGQQVVVIDYNPDNAARIKKQNVSYIYGDMRDEDILDMANLETAKMIISIVPYHEPTMRLLQHIRHFKIQCKVVVLAPYLMDVQAYYDAGASFVLHPESISLKYLVSVLTPEELVRASNVHQKELLDLLQHSLQHGSLPTHQ
jgi:Kef-type K+ transport system membrane component KefB